MVPYLSHTVCKNAYRNTDLESYNLVTRYFRKIYVTYIPLTNIQVSKHSRQISRGFGGISTTHPEQWGRVKKQRSAVIEKKQ